MILTRVNVRKLWQYVVDYLTFQRCAIIKDVLQRVSIAKYTGGGGC